MTWEQWVIALKQQTDAAKTAIQHQLRDISEPRSKPEILQHHAKTIQAWLKKNPPPPHPRRPLPPVRKPPLAPPPAHYPKLKPGVNNAEDMKRFHEQVMLWRNARKGQQGAASLGLILVGGGISFTAIVGFLAKEVIKEAIFSMAEKIAGMGMNQMIYGTQTPSMRQQADYAYMQYMDFKIGSVANYGLTPQYLDKETWCEKEFCGVPYSQLPND